MEKYSKERLERLVKESESLKELIKKVNNRSKSFRFIKKKLLEFNIDYSHLKNDINDKYNKEVLKNICEESFNFSQVLKKLGLKNVGGNHITLKKYIKFFNIDISHFDPYKDNDVRKLRKEILLFDVLKENSNYNRTNLKKRLYKEGLKERKCEFCGQGEEWYGKEMSLILDHINGIRDDNRLENLRILCPNCNATLDTHCGKNNKKSYYKKSENIFCIECGKEISKNTKNKMCSECFSKSRRRVERPSLEILKLEVEEMGYKGTGRKYGVSDVTIRKWLI